MFCHICMIVALHKYFRMRIYCVICLSAARKAETSLPGGRTGRRKTIFTRCTNHWNTHLLLWSELNTLMWRKSEFAMENHPVFSQLLPFGRNSGHTEGIGKAAFNFSTARISASTSKPEALNYIKWPRLIKLEWLLFIFNAFNFSHFFNVCWFKTWNF